MKTIICFFFSIILCATVSAQGQTDGDVIPPEVLECMDAEILSGDRPRIQKIRRGEIFGLRNNPELDADLVRLDLDPATLSSVQKEILVNWVRSGHNVVYLVGNDVPKYAELLGCGYSVDPQYNNHRIVRSIDSDHEVFTDCKGVRFIAFDNKVFHVHGGLIAFPEESVIVAEGASDKKSFAVCGMFSLGEGKVYFCPKTDATSPDSRRFDLNFMHWMLGVEVPGAASTTIGRPKSR